MGKLGAVVATVSLIFASGAAHAVDGTIEINHSVAVRGAVNGSLASDPAGYPVVITQRGSYRLTGNLSPQLVTGIRIDVPNVSLDLNGFAITGTYATGSCAEVPVGFGVYSTQAGVAVSNGQVSGMASQGVSLDGMGSRIERVIARVNCSTGLWVGHAGIVLESQSIANQGHGIFAGEGSVVNRVTVRSNTLFGVLALINSRIMDSTAIGNGNFGIFAEEGSIVSGCSAHNNGSGIVVLSGLVRDSVATANPGDGINTYGAANDIALGNGTGLVKSHTLDCNVVSGVRTCPPSP